jgi:hypothetical protein
MSVCKPCLKEWAKQNGPTCSICKSGLEGYEVVERVQWVALPGRPSEWKWWCVRAFMFSCCCVLSQTLWALVTDPDMIADPSYWDPMDMMFWLGGYICYKFFEMLYHIIGLICLYISECVYGNYETFSDDDSDDDGLDDCV